VTELGQGVRHLDDRRVEATLPTGARTMEKSAAALAILALALAACSPPKEAPAPAAPPSAPAAALPPVSPPPPGTPGGLADDRTPISEGRIDPKGAQGAAQAAQTYYALIGEGKFAEAWALWGDGGKASGLSQADFAKGLDRYASYNAQIGAPGEMEGAAGSSYVAVPVVIYGRLKTGAEVHEKGEMQLRRVNDVDGATAEQRRWHIARIETRPAP
jgi:hypothetical protein